MPEYIEREQAVTVFKTFYGKSLRIMLEALAEEHAADVRPVVRGKWIRNGWSLRCSECGHDMPFSVRNFCPSCGADMREEGVPHG